MDLPPEKEKIENGKEGCPEFHCQLYDTELVHKIAQVLLSGLAGACVDNTTGGLFKSPGSVAVDLRKEMIEYLRHRSESFVAESVILEGDPNTEASDHPYDIISDFVDDFVSSKRNFFSRVSGWLLSEKREDNVDDFEQEMETNGFWLMDRRETAAQTLVKNVDFKNMFHCDKKFNTAEELAEHVVNCDFRSTNCTNEGCTAFSCAKHMEKHDSTCPFKIIPCEQKCSDNIMRRAMDRHCITVCPMKLVNCPFYGLGCQSTVPQCKIQQHCSDELQLHLIYALKHFHKRASEEDLKKRANQMVQLSSSELEAARDARSLTLRVRNLDAKLGPLEHNTAEAVVEESTEDPKENTLRSAEPSEDENSKPENATDARNKVNEDSTETSNLTAEVSKEENIQSSSCELEAARDARSLTLRIRNLDAKLGPLEHNTAEAVVEESTEDPKENTLRSTEPSEDENSKPENATDARNKVSEDSTETSNLTAEVSKEENIQI